MRPQQPVLGPPCVPSQERQSAAAALGSTASVVRLQNGFAGPVLAWLAPRRLVWAELRSMRSEFGPRLPPLERQESERLGFGYCWLSWKCGPLLLMVCRVFDLRGRQLEDSLSLNRRAGISLIPGGTGDASTCRQTA